MNSDIRARTQSALADLSPQLRIAARYLLANESEAAMNSMRTIAADAGVHPTTMVRLARKLGFTDWHELRDELRERLRDRSAGPLAMRARQLASRPDSGRTQAMVDELLVCEENNLRRTWQEIDAGILENAVEAMRSARRVFFLGRRSCYPVAFGLYYSFGMVRENGHLVTDSGAGIANSFASLTSEDLVVGIGFTPYSRETVELVHTAKEVGAKTLVVTDTIVSPLAENATFVFVVANESPTLFQSILAAQSVAQSLIALLTAADGQAAVERLDTREARLERFGAYWTEAHGRTRSE